VPDTKVDVPAVVVEFVSGGRRDMVRDYERKRDEYLDAGVVEYWIIDRFRRMMTVYRAGVCGPTVEHVLEASTYRTALMPGFELPLARLLARADAWKKPKAKRGSRPPTDADPAVIPPPATDPDPDPAPPAPTNPPTGGER
jgi:hypothetical protein